MGTYRRNAFAVGKPGDAGGPEPQLPIYSDQDFGIVSLDEEECYESQNEDEEEIGNDLCSLTEEQITAFREVFDLFDSNGGGTIDAEELDLALKSVDIQLSMDDLQDVLAVMDKDGNGEIDFFEFLNLMTNAERFLEGFSSGGKEKKKRENLLFEALTQFMKRSALHSINEIVGFYHTKYKRIQAPHVVGHYAAGARVIGLTETQLRRHMETLKARHAADDNKSPYAEPLHIVFGKAVRPKKRRIAKDKFPQEIEDKETIKGMSQPRGRIRLRFAKLSIEPSFSNPNLAHQSPVVQKTHPCAISPAAQLLMQRPMKQESSPRPLKKNGWLSQRIKPFVVELPVVNVKREKKSNSAIQSLTIDDLPKIRDKVAEARAVYFKRVRETKKQDSDEHWKSLGPEHIDSDQLRNYFRLAFNAYTPYTMITSV